MPPEVKGQHPPRPGKGRRNIMPGPGVAGDTVEAHNGPARPPVVQATRSQLGDSTNAIHGKDPPARMLKNNASRRTHNPYFPPNPPTGRWGSFNFLGN